MINYKTHTLILGSGAAGLAAATRLKAQGIDDIIMITEGLQCGTSINTGSDKQTYYKVGMYAKDADSPELLGETFFEGGSMHGDLALVEASLSSRCFSNLVNIGVPFPSDEYGQFIGYKTDHDPMRRATSCGPYTSREMCRSLIKEIEKLNVKVLEKRVAVSLITVDENGTKRAAGCIAIDRNNKDEYECFLAENVIFAVGGPGGLYKTSVYPAVHTGAIGLALAEGAKARNLPESQFGLASTKFRWNVSGTYMQVLPRFISTDADGVSNPREFLYEQFANDTNDMHSMVFLKGYQWPFDVRKAKEGSSRVDLMVYNENVVNKRRVFLDFRSNSEYLDFNKLSDEARVYLERSDALFGTPLERLHKMNPGAIELYNDHGIDLATEPLEVAVCSQHNNGGLAGNLWYESENITHLFPIGEVNGSHGVCRPGGSALNAGQVGAFRATDFIIAKYNDVTLDMAKAEAAAEANLANLKSMTNGNRDWKLDRKDLRERMSQYAAQFRSQSDLVNAVKSAKELLSAIKSEGYPQAEAIEGLRNYQLCLAHVVYLEAILYQIETGAGSRGSALVLNSANEVVDEDTKFRSKVLESVWNGNSTQSTWADCRELPACDDWFEQVWRRYREKEIYQ